MQAYGTDRLKAGRGEELILLCSRSKGWIARVERHPGTAVAWEERIFEVVAAEAGPAGGVRYVLEPWRDEHVIRVSDSYDAESEVRREADFVASRAREQQRKTANVAGVLIGLLPAVVQEHLASELGLLAPKLTAISVILPMLFAGWVINDSVRRTMNPNATKTPAWLLVLAVYFVFESLIRFYLAWFQQRPIASVAGFIAYVPYYVVNRRRAVSPFAQQRGEKLFITKPTDDVALRDAYSIREPLLTLLSPAEQNALAERFAFDYRRTASTVAFVILAGCVAGVISAIVSLPRFTAVLSLIVAVGIGAEQVARLAALQRGPAGSLLAFIVRPFTRKLLS